MSTPSSRPDARTAREHATWEPDQSLHGSHCGIQGPHSLGYGREGQCDCGRDALLAQVARLEQERDEADADAANSNNYWHGLVTELRAQISEAEARAVQAERERDEAVERAKALDKVSWNATQRRQEAQARAQRYREALEKISSRRCLNSKSAKGSCDWECVVCVARRALLTDREEETT